MRKPVQFFHDLTPGSMIYGGAAGTLCCLCDDGTVWRRMMTGYGSDGRSPPTAVWWLRCGDNHDTMGRLIPPLPQD